MDPKLTFHQDGTISIRVTRHAFQEIHGALWFSHVHWTNGADKSTTPDLDRDIAREIEGLRCSLRDAYNVDADRHGWMQIH